MPSRAPDNAVPPSASLAATHGVAAHEARSRAEGRRARFLAAVAFIAVFPGVGCFWLAPPVGPFQTAGARPAFALEAGVFVFVWPIVRRRAAVTAGALSRRARLLHNGARGTGTGGKTITQSPAPPRLVRFRDLDFVPRFEHGDMAELAEVAGAGDGTELGVGFARLTKARIEWTVRYDEVLIVLAGELTVHAGGKSLTAGPRDSVWLPRDTPLVYEAEEALIAYAIHPADWAERGVG